VSRHHYSLPRLLLQSTCAEPLRILPVAASTSGGNPGRRSTQIGGDPEERDANEEGSSRVGFVAGGVE